MQSAAVGNEAKESKAASKYGEQSSEKRRDPDSVEAAVPAASNLCQAKPTCQPQWDPTLCLHLQEPVSHSALLYFHSTNLLGFLIYVFCLDAFALTALRRTEQNHMMSDPICKHTRPEVVKVTSHSTATEDACSLRSAAAIHHNLHFNPPAGDHE